MLREKTGEGKGKVSPAPLLYFQYVSRAFFLLPFFALPSAGCPASQPRGRAEVGAILGSPGLKGGGGGARNWRL